MENSWIEVFLILTHAKKVYSGIPLSGKLSQFIGCDDFLSGTYMMGNDGDDLEIRWDASERIGQIGFPSFQTTRVGVVDGEK